MARSIFDYLPRREIKFQISKIIINCNVRLCTKINVLAITRSTNKTNSDHMNQNFHFIIIECVVILIRMFDRFNCKYPICLIEFGRVLINATRLFSSMIQQTANRGMIHVCHETTQM